MKLGQALVIKEASEQYDVRVIKISDKAGLQMFSDFYNEAGTLSWKLTPQRLLKRLGSRGRLWGLFVKGSDEMVGSIGLKVIKDEEGSSLAEMGYLMLAKEHSSLPNVLKLYRAALKRVKMFDAVFMTTDVKNKKINKLLDRDSKSTLFLHINSPFTTNKLYVWMIGKSEESKEIISLYFDEHIIKEF